MFEGQAIKVLYIRIEWRLPSHTFPLIQPSHVEIRILSLRLPYPCHDEHNSTIYQWDPIFHRKDPTLW